MRMASRPLTFALAAAFALLAFGAAALATTVQLAGIPTLVDGSPLIVEGRVLSATPVKVSRAPGIVTDYEVLVSARLKGSSPDRITVRVPGGKLPGGQQALIEGMPTLRAGASVLLLLEALPTGAFDDSKTYWLPLGLGQGHFELTRQGGRAVFRRDLHGQHLSATGAPVCTGGEWQGDFDAEDLRAFIKARAEGSR